MFKYFFFMFKKRFHVRSCSACSACSACFKLVWDMFTRPEHAEHAIDCQNWPHLLSAVCLNNYHERLRARPLSWMVAGFLPSLDKDVTNNWDKEGGNSNVVRNIEVFLQAFDTMFTGWNEFSQEPPMEWTRWNSDHTHALCWPYCR